MGSVKISNGNQKLGQIPSVSLPAIKTCRKDCTCCTKCYAHKLERLRPSVRSAYQANLDLLNRDPNTYWREVEATIMLNRFFRFHVSGDIPDRGYFRKMVYVSERNPHCQILCFTKRYSFVNEYLASGEVLPDNLHVIFSAWKGMEMENPYNLPEAHVIYRDGSTTATHDLVPCLGNCTDCACTDSGCWTLQPGQQVVFHEH
jgi:hypothetical protein